MKKNWHSIICFAALLICAAAPFFAPISAWAENPEKFDKTWQHVAVKRLLGQSLGMEEAMVWHLDYNGFAVQLPNCLMVFDYDNEKPAPQYDKTQDIGIVESLLTGVVNPEEIKDENVVFFFSHGHPAGKLLEMLSWKDTINDVLYVIPEEVYLGYEEQIKALKEKEKDQPGKKDVFSVIKVIKPNGSCTIKGHVVNTPEVSSPLKAKNKQPYPGIEYFIRTSNSLTIYHSGSFTCRHCTDDLKELYNEAWFQGGQSGRKSSVISTETKNLRFEDGRLVGTDVEGAATPETTGGKQRIVLTIYSNPQLPDGYIYLATTFGPVFAWPRFWGGMHMEEVKAVHDQKERERFMERDKFLTDRNPLFEAEKSDALWLEFEQNKIKEYFAQFSGNQDVIRTLKDTAVKRHAKFYADMREYCGANTTLEQCFEKWPLGKFSGYLNIVSYSEPSERRGSCEIVTTNYESIPLVGYFWGYFTVYGYPLFPDRGLISKIYEEYH
jgi:hypothetical protein